MNVRWGGERGGCEGPVARQIWQKGSQGRLRPFPESLSTDVLMWRGYGAVTMLRLLKLFRFVYFAIVQCRSCDNFGAWARLSLLS